MAGTCLQCCVLVLAAFSVVVNAACEGTVDFVVGNNALNPTNTTTTSFKPVDSSGVVRCSRCKRDSKHPLMWFKSDGTLIPKCDDDDMVLPCTEIIGNGTLDLDLVFSTFLTGTYKCGGARSTNQENIVIDALGPPSITAQPRDVTIPQGTTTTLTCSATGSGKLMYSWERRSDSDWNTVTNQQSYTTNSNMAVGQYTYRCVVRNEAGPVISNGATVNVYGPPSITTQPKGVTIPQGTTTTLTCSATTRGGKLMYSWERRSGSSWTAVTNGPSYTTNSNMVVGQYTYRCVVRNEAGPVISREAIVNVYGSPNITTHPTSQLTTVSMSVTLNCEGTGRGSIIYQWETRIIRRGQWSVISNSNNRRLVVRNLQESRQYRCVVSNEAGETRSNVATVAVLKITTHPSSTTVIALQDVTLTCSASVDDVTYSWHRDGGSIPSRSSGNTLTITRATPGPPDEGVYFCIASKERISVESKRATLTVDDQLSIGVTPTDPMVGEGGTVQFITTASGVNMRNFVYQWKKKGRRSSIPNKVSGVNGTVLTIPNLAESDEGVYFCTVTNEWSNNVRSDDVTLTVQIIPQIVTNPDDVTVFIGRSTQLTCNALGAGIEYQWMKDDVVVSGTNSNMLRITNIEESDEGVYKCVASNKGGEVESDPATITVYGPPMVQELPQQVYVVLGEEFQITCTATNDQDAPTSLMFSWRTPKGVEFNETTTVEDDSHTASSTLHISSVNNSNGSKYTCNVRNIGGGGVGTSFTLIVEKKSSPPTSFNIAQALINSLQLTWTVPTRPHGSINYYNVYYYNNSDQPVQVVNVTNFTGNYTLDNLRPYTEYSVFVTAVRLIGTTSRSLEGEKSDILSARTLAGEPSLEKVDKNKPELIINENSSVSDGTMSDKTFTIDLPAISLENGPFSHLYIIVAVNDSVIKNVEEISTENLLEKTNDSSLLYYVAAVIYSYQYNSNNTMRYILGAGDDTTDPDGHMFYNREVQGNYYFFRIFSANSTQENEIFTTTMIESFHSQSSDGGGGSGSTVGVVVGVIVALLIFIAIITAIILFLFYYKTNHLKHNQNDLSQVVPSDCGIQMKEKEMKEEKAKPLPVVNPVALSAQVPSDNLLMEVVTSAGQPTTLFVELPYADESEITWKKDNKPSNYPVLPDGSLYITNTNLSDSGQYTVTASSAESSMSERLRLKVINPQLPSEMSKRKSIKVDDFPEHVAMMRSKKNEQFEADYESMVVNIPFSQHTAKLHVNASKNRYKNIVPYDHSRVVLSLQGHKPGSDYVNASFIDGYKEPKAYIAAQGPVADTVDTFWKMIWEKNVATIVMVTRLVEDAKVKCHQYWPKNTEPATYGDYKVTVLKQEEIAKYCIRNFTIEKVTNQKHEVRSVTQFYFTAWPDHGVPKYSTALLEFQKRIDKHHKRKTGKPMLVHCSAGVGRTGTFIAIDSEIQHIRHENIVDVYNCVLRLRYWRNFMVQSSAQYTLIHTALLEYIACGDTSITAPTKSVQDKVSELSAVAPSAKKTGFELQFEKLTKASPKESEFTYVTASSSKNKAKNRNKKFLSPDNSRVQLAPVGNKPDYINACYIDGYRHSKEFIVGPGPMESTSVDFWKMLWENKSCSLIMLGELVENGEEASFKYWPDKGQNVEFGTFVIETISEEPLSESVIKRIMKITHVETKASRTITQLQYVRWPQQSCPSSSVPMVDMIEIMERVQRRTGNGPIIVHCSDGVGRSGTFCALVVSINRFKAEQMVDVFQTIITMRTQKPQLVTNADQYKFIHNALIAMLQRFANYDNFSEGATM